MVWYVKTELQLDTISEQSYEYGSICVRETGYKQGKEEGRGILTSTRINIQAPLS